jgi:predicted transposase/invertase (TIGR01784 family)
MPQKPPSSSPHDRLFKLTFGDPEQARGLLRPLLPAELARRIDWDSLALEPGSFVDESLAWRHTDLLFRASLDGGTLFLYLLIEHQSDEDPLMPFRCLVYVTRVLERYVQQHEGTRALPAVLPLVVSHAARPWNAPLELFELFDLPAASKQAVAAHLPSLRFLLDDLALETEDTLRRRELGEQAKLTVLALRQARVARAFADALIRWTDLVRALDAAPGGREKLTALLTYILSAGEDPPENLRDVLQSHIGHEASEVVMTTAERLIQEGHQRGRAEGLAEGLTKGQATVLVRLLTLKFGPLPDDLQARIASAPIEELDRWVERVLAARTLRDVFA